MSGYSLSRRLAKVEQKQADWARREKLTKCICGGTTIALSVAPELFEAEMNRQCPVHGFRRFDEIVAVLLGTTPETEGVETDGPATEEDAKDHAKVHQLLKTYALRLSQEYKSSD